MKKIFIDFYGALNLGDDLFIKILIERYKSTSFYVVLDKKNRVPFLKYKNIHFLSPPKVNIIYRLFAKLNKKQKEKNHITLLKKYNDFYINNLYFYDGFINIGGSIFMQPQTRSIHDELYSMRIEQFKGKKKYILGANFGPYQDMSFKNKYKNIFMQVDDVSFREQQSKIEFNELTNIRVNPDIVFQLETRDNNKGKNKAKAKNVGVSVIDLSRRSINAYYSDYYNFIVETCLFWLQKEYSVTLFSFCEGEGDLSFANSIIKTLNKKHEAKIKIVSYEGDIENYINEMSKISIMYATRFHAMILSFLLCDYIIPISYSRKMNNVLDDINFSGVVVNIDQISLNEHVNHNDFLVKNINDLDLIKMKKGAERHFEKLDEFLLSENKTSN